MFSGIVFDCFPITSVQARTDQVTIDVTLDERIAGDVKLGASIALDGVCLTVSAVRGTTVTFDMIGETLRRTTLGDVSVGRRVNVERSLRWGDEIGGHLVSGHVFGTVEIAHIDEPPNNYVVTFRAPPEWMKYLVTKGFVALDGASLTVVDVDRRLGTFTVWLIPETLKRTTFGFKRVGDRVNVEFEYTTQIVVDTVERLARDGSWAIASPANSAASPPPPISG